MVLCNLSSLHVCVVVVLCNLSSLHVRLVVVLCNLSSLHVCVVVVLCNLSSLHVCVVVVLCNLSSLHVCVVVVLCYLSLLHVCVVMVLCNLSSLHVRLVVVLCNLSSLHVRLVVLLCNLSSLHVRIVVVLVVPERDRRRFLLWAYDMDMTNGDYVFYTCEMIPENKLLNTAETWMGNDGRDEDAKKGFEAAFHVRPRLPMFCCFRFRLIHVYTEQNYPDQVFTRHKIFRTRSLSRSRAIWIIVGPCKRGIRPPFTGSRSIWIVI